MLTQKLPSEIFTATTKINFTPANINNRVTMIIFGMDYAFLSLVQKQDGNYISYNTCFAADKNAIEQEQILQKWDAKEIYLRVNVNAGAVCSFSYSKDGKSFEKIPGSFTAKPGKWVGAKIGLFCTGTVKTNDAGYADIDWVHFTKI